MMLVLPIGEFFGTFYPTVGSSERFHTVRSGELRDLDDAPFAVWRLLHGPPSGFPEVPWTRTSLRSVTALSGVGDVDAILDGLLAVGLATEVRPGTDSAIEFARDHRMGSRMLGLGNSAEQPSLYGIGLFDHPVITVSRMVFNVWEGCDNADSLWSLLQSLAAEERAAGGSERDLTDPARMLSGLLLSVHRLLSASAVFLEPRL